MRRIEKEAEPAFDHFLILPFAATNLTPFEFHWIKPARVARDYGAMLVRISAEYERRFGMAAQARSD
jgi:hypothetical protein